MHPEMMGKLTQGNNYFTDTTVQQGGVLLLTGLSGAGKTTIGLKLQQVLMQSGLKVILLDGDQLRSGICKDLGLDYTGRKEHIRRSSELARLLFDQGCTVICSFIAPLEEYRSMFRDALPCKERFFEIYLKCSFTECARRDVKGLYQKARNGALSDLTGFSARSPYEIPKNPDLVIDTEEQDISTCIEQVLTLVSLNGWFR